MDVVEGKITLNITQEIINGKKNPIAVVIDDYFGGWITRTMSVKLGIRTSYGIYKMEKPLWQWLKKWESKELVKPISFKLIYLHDLEENE
jgi:hypothetical protein